MKTQEIDEKALEALDRAENGKSTRNYLAIIDGFEEKGIDPHDIEPRRNVFTYKAWKAKGRQVKRGEHGVRVLTYIPIDKEKIDEKTGEKKEEHYTAPRAATVFHISQTRLINNTANLPGINSD